MPSCAWPPRTGLPLAVTAAQGSRRYPNPSARSSTAGSRSTTSGCTTLWVEAADVTLDDRSRSNPGRGTLHDAENVALSGLYIYPLKSCAGISLDSAELSATGLRYDRRWMLVDETGGFMSQRAHPRMALISTHLSDEQLTVSAPGMPDLEVPLRQGNESLLDVRVFGDTNRGALVGGEADSWFSEFLQFPCRLVHKPDDDLRLVDSSFAQSGD